MLQAQKPSERVPFFAAGISSVMHPHNPFAPTMHFNYRQGPHSTCESDSLPFGTCSYGSQVCGSLRLSHALCRVPSCEV